MAVLRPGCSCDAVGLGDEAENWRVHLVGRPAAAAAGRPGEVGGGTSRRGRRARRRVVQVPNPILETTHNALSITNVNTIISCKKKCVPYYLKIQKGADTHICEVK